MFTRSGPGGGVGTEAAAVCPHPGRVDDLSAQLALPGADLYYTRYSEVRNSSIHKTCSIHTTFMCLSDNKHS